MQRSFHDSLHLSVQIWIASCDLARKGAFDYAAKCQFRIPRMRCFKTLQRDKFRKLTKGKHMMLALYLTLIEYFHFFSYVFQRIKGQLLPEKLWSSQMSDAPSMICRALCTGRLEGCVCQWLKGKKESCLKIHSVRVQSKHVSNEWRGNVWRETHIPASGCTGTLYIHSYYKASVQSSKEKTPTPKHQDACWSTGPWYTVAVQMLWCICDVINQSIEAGLSILLVYIFII